MAAIAAVWRVAWDEDPFSVAAAATATPLVGSMENRSIAG
jgi:hypothetical protein